MSTERIVRAVIAAYEARDLKGVLVYCHPDMHFSVVSSADHPFHADGHGLEAFERALMRYHQDLIFERFALAELLVDGDRAATISDVVFRSRMTGARHHTRNALFWTVEGGRITKILEFQDTATVAEVR